MILYRYNVYLIQNNISIETIYFASTFFGLERMAAEITNHTAVMVMTKDSDIPIIVGDLLHFNQKLHKG